MSTYAPYAHTPHLRGKAGRSHNTGHKGRKRVNNLAASTGIKGKKIDHLLKRKSYFTKSFINANLYEGIDHSIETIATQSIIISSSKISDELVYNFVKIIMENFEEFKNSHRVYSNLTKESLFQGLTAPLHSGVKKYFQEENNKSTH